MEQLHSAGATKWILGRKVGISVGIGTQPMTENQLKGKVVAMTNWPRRVAPGKLRRRLPPLPGCSQARTTIMDLNSPTCTKAPCLQGASWQFWEKLLHELTIVRDADRGCDLHHLASIQPGQTTDIRKTIDKKKPIALQGGAPLRCASPRRVAPSAAHGLVRFQRSRIAAARTARRTQIVWGRVRH